MKTIRRIASTAALAAFLYVGSDTQGQAIAQDIATSSRKNIRSTSLVGIDRKLENDEGIGKSFNLPIVGDLGSALDLSRLPYSLKNLSSSFLPGGGLGNTAGDLEGLGDKFVTEALEQIINPLQQTFKNVEVKVEELQKVFRDSADKINQRKKKTRRLRTSEVASTSSNDEHHEVEKALKLESESNSPSSQSSKFNLLNFNLAPLPDFKIINNKPTIKPIMDYLKNVDEMLDDALSQTKNVLSNSTSTASNSLNDVHQSVMSVLTRNVIRGDDPASQLFETLQLSLTDLLSTVVEQLNICMTEFNSIMLHFLDESSILLSPGKSGLTDILYKSGALQLLDTSVNQLNNIAFDNMKNSKFNLLTPANDKFDNEDNVVDDLILSSRKLTDITEQTLQNNVNHSDKKQDVMGKSYNDNVAFSTMRTVDFSPDSLRRYVDKLRQMQFMSVTLDSFAQLMSKITLTLNDVRNNLMAMYSNKFDKASNLTANTTIPLAHITNSTTFPSSKISSFLFDLLRLPTTKISPSVNSTTPTATQTTVSSYSTAVPIDSTTLTTTATGGVTTTAEAALSVTTTSSVVTSANSTSSTATALDNDRDHSLASTATAESNVNVDHGNNYDNVSYNDKNVSYDNYNDDNVNYKNSNNNVNHENVSNENNNNVNYGNDNDSNYENNDNKIIEEVNQHGKAGQRRLQADNHFLDILDLDNLKLLDPISLIELLQNTLHTFTKNIGETTQNMQNEIQKNVRFLTTQTAMLFSNPLMYNSSVFNSNGILGELATTQQLNDLLNFVFYFNRNLFNVTDNKNTNMEKKRRLNDDHYNFEEDEEQKQNPVNNGDNSIKNKNVTLLLSPSDIFESVRKMAHDLNNNLKNQTDKLLNNKYRKTNFSPSSLPNLSDLFPSNISMANMVYSISPEKFNENLRKYFFNNVANRNVTQLLNSNNTATLLNLNNLLDGFYIPIIDSSFLMNINYTEQKDNDVLATFAKNFQKCFFNASNAINNTIISFNNQIKQLQKNIQALPSLVVSHDVSKVLKNNDLINFMVSKNVLNNNLTANLLSLNNLLHSDILPINLNLHDALKSKNLSVLLSSLYNNRVNVNLLNAIIDSINNKSNRNATTTTSLSPTSTLSKTTSTIVPRTESSTLLTTDPTTQMVVDPTTQMVVDPTTQMVVDPTTQMVVDPTTQMVVDPTTQMVVDPTTQMVVDPTTRMIVDPTTRMIVDPTTRMIVDPTTQMIVDPTTQMIVDPTTQMIVDPTTHMVVDPTTHMVVDPTTHMVVDPTTQMVVNPTTHVLMPINATLIPMNATLMPINATLMPINTNLMNTNLMPINTNLMNTNLMPIKTTTMPRLLNHSIGHPSRRLQQQNFNDGLAGIGDSILMIADGVARATGHNKDNSKVPKIGNSLGGGIISMADALDTTIRKNPEFLSTISEVVPEYQNMNTLTDFDAITSKVKNTFNLDDVNLEKNLKDYLKLDNLTNNLKLPALDLENLKLPNLKLDDLTDNLMKLDNLKLDNLKLDNLKLDNLKLDNLKLDNLKLDNLKLDNITNITDSLNNMNMKLDNLKLDNITDNLKLDSFKLASLTDNLKLNNFKLDNITDTFNNIKLDNFKLASLTDNLKLDNLNLDNITDTFNNIKLDSFKLASLKPDNLRLFNPKLSLNLTDLSDVNKFSGNLNKINENFKIPKINVDVTDKSAAIVPTLASMTVPTFAPISISPTKLPLNMNDVFEKGVDSLREAITTTSDNFANSIKDEKFKKIIEQSTHNTLSAIENLKKNVKMNDVSKNFLAINDLQDNFLTKKNNSNFLKEVTTDVDTINDKKINKKIDENDTRDGGNKIYIFNNKLPKLSSTADDDAAKKNIKVFPFVYLSSVKSGVTNDDEHEEKKNAASDFVNQFFGDSHSTTSPSPVVDLTTSNNKSSTTPKKNVVIAKKPMTNDKDVEKATVVDEEQENKFQMVEEVFSSSNSAKTMGTQHIFPSPSAPSLSLSSPLRRRLQNKISDSNLAFLPSFLPIINLSSSLPSSFEKNNIENLINTLSSVGVQKTLENVNMKGSNLAHYGDVASLNDLFILKNELPLTNLTDFYEILGLKKNFDFNVSSLPALKDDFFHKINHNSLSNTDKIKSSNAFSDIFATLTDFFDSTALSKPSSLTNSLTNDIPDNSKFMDLSKSAMDDVIKSLNKNLNSLSLFKFKTQKRL